jgi:hypothetical protein
MHNLLPARALALQQLQDAVRAGVDLTHWPTLKQWATETDRPELAGLTYDLFRMAVGGLFAPAGGVRLTEEGET